MYKSFEDLEVWKRSCRMAVDVYEAFRQCRDFYFRDQVQRAVVSIPSNIAEGAERDSEKEFRYFLRVAKGSAAELRTQLYIAEKIELISPEVRRSLCAAVVEISKMLHGLIKSIHA